VTESPRPQTLTTTEIVKLSDREFAELCSLVYDQFGIVLNEKKRSLVEGRLQSLLRRAGYASYQEYYQAVLRQPDGEGLSDLVNRISTNHTFFNREAGHFRIFVEQVLPELTRAIEAEGKHELRVWCAAASTGQEPYFLAMLMMNYFAARYSAWDAGLLATDISSAALQTATQGVYSAEEIEALPREYVKYLNRQPDGSFRIADAVREEVVYRRFNLVNQTYPFKRPFHVIFCRNVMIYFDQPTKNRIVENMVRFLYPNGYLFVGQSEALSQRHPKLRYVAPSVYCRVE
jgi:chemotaxis protein methyltransferase CheR